MKYIGSELFSVEYMEQQIIEYYYYVVQLLVESGVLHVLYVICASVFLLFVFKLILINSTVYSTVYHLHFINFPNSTNLKRMLVCPQIFKK